MMCPKCMVEDLVIADRQGIEIDYCPQCRGVWLDRGELDKIIDRTVDYQPPPPPPRERYAEPRREDYERRGRYEERRRGRNDGKSDRDYRKYKKKKHIIKEIFDIFD